MCTMHQMPTRTVIAALVAATALLSAGGARAVPGTITYTGRVLKNGSPASGALNVDFALYDASSGGTALWSESHAAVAVKNGVFTVLLGSLVPLSAKVLSGAARWLEIKVGGQLMGPRTAVTSVAYAITADNAVGDLTPTSITVNGKLVINSSGEWVGAATGLQGPKGDKGDKGDQGATGAQGPQGTTGPQGPAGPTYGCVMRKSCPAGWSNLGLSGIIMPVSTWTTECAKIGSPGGAYNSGWNWCHPVLCCQNL